MFNKTNEVVSKRKKFELKITPGESIRDSIIKAGIKSVEESAYIPGNNTEKIIQIAKKTGVVLDRATGFVCATESSGAFGKIAYKTTKDIARGDTVCTGLCVVSGACEAVALCCSTIKIIPFRGKIYVGSKIVSKGCMSFRNACAGEGC